MRAMGLLLVAVLALAACTPKEEPPMPRAEARQILVSRPDLDEAVLTYEKLLKSLSQRISDGGLSNDWRYAIFREDSQCFSDDFDRRNDRTFNAAMARLQWYRTAPPITPQHWDATVDVVAAVAKTNGFKKKVEFGDRDISFTQDRYGAILDLRSTPTETVLGVVTGCHRRHGEPVDSPG